MDNATFLRMFQSHNDAIDHLDGNFGVSHRLIVTRMLNDHEDPDDLQSYRTAKDAVWEEVIAKHFLVKADPKRFAPLMASIQNNFILGQDKYPMTLSKAYDLIVNYVNRHKHGGIDSQDLSMLFYQDNNARQGRRRG
jgi:hypothetical protein